MKSRITQAKNELENYLKEREKHLHNFFDRERVQFVCDLITILNNPDLSYKALADAVLRKIIPVLESNEKFSGKTLRPLLQNIKEEMLKVRYKDVIYLDNKYLDYKYLLDMTKTIRFDNYYCSFTVPFWIEFNVPYEDMPHHPYHINDEAFGWKFHLSFDNEKNNLEKGMNIVLKHLMDAKILTFKLIAHGRDQMSNKTQGKNVTVYVSDDRPLSEWRHLLSVIENDLKTAGVRPGEKAVFTNKVANSEYISYRNDKDTNGAYTQNAFNASLAPDPFVNLELSPHPSQALTSNRFKHK